MTDSGRACSGSFSGAKPSHRISPLLIEKYKRERRESITKRGGGRAPATVERELALLSRIFTRARPFASACREAGIRDLRWHDLRHTLGTRLAEAGHSEATLAELMGHSEPKTTRRYTHGTERAKRAAVEAASTRAEGGSERWADLKLVAK